MTREKRFEKLCTAFEKAADKWGDGLTHQDIIHACLSVAAAHFAYIHDGQTCSEKCRDGFCREFVDLCDAFGGKGDGGGW